MLRLWRRLRCESEIFIWQLAGKKKSANSILQSAESTCLLTMGVFSVFVKPFSRDYRRQSRIVVASATYRSPLLGVSWCRAPLLIIIKKSYVYVKTFQLSIINYQLFFVPLHSHFGNSVFYWKLAHILNAYKCQTSLNVYNELTDLLTGSRNRLGGTQPNTHTFFIESDQHHPFQSCTWTAAIQHLAPQ